ncbi:hypothetical protein Tco_0431552 [Tanacetum coccineum]
MLLDREATYDHRAWTSSEDRSAAIEAYVRTLEGTGCGPLMGSGLHHFRLQLTTALGCIQTLEARDPEPQDSIDCMDFVKMPPKRTVATTTPMTDAQIKALIAHGVVDALAEHDTNRIRNGDDNHDSGSDGRRRMPIAYEYTYTDFLKCQPLNFKGTEGVVGLTQWFEKMEFVFHISNCTIACQIKFATCTLQGNALTWSNSHVRTVRHDVAYAMPCKTLKKMMTDKYCPMGKIKKLEIKMRMFPEESDEMEKYVGGLPDMILGSVMVLKPKIMQDAIEFATELMDQKIHTLVERPGEKKPYGGSKPLCPKCNYHHDGLCTPKFTNYKKGHLKKDCPRLKNINHGNQARNGNVMARAYAVGIIGTNPNSNVGTGTFLLNNRHALIIFDTGADRSFVSIAFGSLIDIIPTTLDTGVDVELADSRIIWVNPLIRGCTLNFLNHPFNIDLMPVEMGSFDVIIGGVPVNHLRHESKCRNEMGQGLAQRPVIVGVSHDLRGDSWGCVPRSLFWREDLDEDGERGFDCLTFALVSLKAHHEGCKASHGGFPYCETHLPLVMSAKDTIAVQRCGLSAKELNEFLSFYPIPSEYDVILPKSTQTIFNAPPGYVGLLNPFGCAKLTTFIIMCKAYGCEPSVDIFQGFFNLCRAGSWITFQKRSEKQIPNLLPKLNLKSFKDKLPPNIDENPYFQRLGRYPTSVRVFDDPILFLAGLKPSWEFGQQRPAIIVGEMAFRNFVYTEDDDDLAFLRKVPFPGFGTGSPSTSVNTEFLKDVEEPEVQPAEITTDSGESLKAGVFIVHPGSVAARIKERKCKTRGGSSRPLVKRKLASGSSSSRVVQAKNSASKDDALILSISDDDEGLPGCFELKDANACHLKILAITPPAWKGHLDNQMDLELLDLHDCCYA